MVAMLAVPAGRARGQEGAVDDSLRSRAWLREEMAHPHAGRVTLMSMVLPGSGQVANGSWAKGGLFFAAYGGLLGWAVSLHQDRQDALGELNLTRGTGQESFWAGEVERFEDQRNAKFWLMGLVTVVSMAEAFVDAHLKHFDERIDAEVAWEPGDGREPRLTVGITVAPGR